MYTHMCVYTHVEIQIYLDIDIGRDLLQEPGSCHCGNWLGKSEICRVGWQLRNWCCNLEAGFLLPQRSQFCS